MRPSSVSPCRTCRVRTIRCCWMPCCRASRRLRDRSSISPRSSMSGIKDVLAPPNEEGTRATILKWCKAVGDTVAKDEPLLELETDKVTVEIPAPVSGTLIEVLKAENAEVSPDEVLARLRLPGDATVPQESKPPTAAPRIEGSRASLTARARSDQLSPSVRRLLHEHAVTPGDISGTGRNGRVTAQDVARHVSQAAQVPRAAPVSQAGHAAQAAHSVEGASNTLVPH